MMVPDEDGQALLDSIGELFLELRQEAGLTQRQAAEKAESIQARVSNLENGKADVFILTLQKWARVYGYDIQLHVVPIEDEGEKAFNELLASTMAEIEDEDNADNGGATEASVLPEV